MAKQTRSGHRILTGVGARLIVLAAVLVAGLSAVPMASADVVVHRTVRGKISNLSEIGPGGVPGALNTVDNQLTSDNRNDYVEFTPTRRRHVSLLWVTPDDLDPVASTANVAVNYRGPDQSGGDWKLEVRDVRARRWIPLFDNSGVDPTVWNYASFEVVNPARFADRSGRYRFRFQTSNATAPAQLDYLAISGTNPPPPATPPPTSPPPTSPPPPSPPPPTTPPPEPPVAGELLTIGDLSYAGAFRLSTDTFGDSSVDYAVGTLAHNAINQSLFIVGHAHHNAIAEFDIPQSLGTGNDLADLPVVRTPRQPFATVLDRAPSGNPDNQDRITGMLVLDDQLIVNSNHWYDAAGTAKDTTLVVRDAAQLNGTVDGFYQLAGGATAAGYLSTVPAEWHSALGSTVLSGWASNYSIISRYSVGPSLFSFDPASLSTTPVGEGQLPATAHMVFPHSGGRYLHRDALKLGPNQAPALWNYLSRAVYGFVVPGTRTFAVFGSNGGMESGVGYKITQDDGHVCPGHCAYRADDYRNYYWFFDLDQILNSPEPHLPRPYAHGPWSVPFDDGGDHAIIGATFDTEGRTLYLSLSEAGQVGTYDRPPLIVAYRL